MSDQLPERIRVTVTVEEKGDRGWRDGWVPPMMPGRERLLGENHGKAAKSAQKTDASGEFL